MKNTFKNLDLIQIVGFSISALLSIGLLLSGQETLVSIILGFVTASFVQLLDVQKRISDSEEKVLQASGMSKSLFSNEWLLKVVRNMVSSYYATINIKAGLFTQFAKDTLVECQNILQFMADGKLVSRRTRMKDFSLELIKIAKSMIFATDTGNIAYWRETYMQDYFELNVKAIKRGVKITRIFIYPLRDLRKNEDILQQHQNAGIDVYFVDSGKLPKDLVGDYMVVDGKMANYIEFSPDGHVLGNVLSIKQEQVGEFGKRFEVIMQYAKQISVLQNSKG